MAGGLGFRVGGVGPRSRFGVGSSGPLRFAAARGYRLQEAQKGQG